MGNAPNFAEISSSTLEPSKIQINTFSSPLHILANSFSISQSYLKFEINSKFKAKIVTRFFVFEHGLSFIQDSTKPLPCQEFEIFAGTNNKVLIRLNQAYIDEYLYEPPLSLPIVIEASLENWTEITILEIKQKKPRVVQQRVITNNQLYEIRPIYDAPHSQSEERDKLCVICIYNLREIVCEPCCHICLCFNCATVMRSQIIKKCPICRKGNS